MDQNGSVTAVSKITIGTARLIFLHKKKVAHVS